jgi:hypothetical protein
MLLLTLVSLFGIQPLLAQIKADALPREVMESVLRNRFATWHGVSSILYLVQSLLGLLLVGGCAGRRPRWPAQPSGDRLAGNASQRPELPWKLRLLRRGSQGAAGFGRRCG